MNHEYMILRLCENIQQTFGAKVNTPSLYEQLAADILNHTKNQLSPSTLRRVMGYDKSTIKPSSYTLNVLANYCGYADWNNYTAGYIYTARQLEQFNRFSALYTQAKHSISLRLNPKYCGENVETFYNAKGEIIGQKIGPGESKSPFIRYSDVLNFKYIIRDCTRQYSSFYDAEDAIIKEYDTLESLILDNWELD